MVDEIGHAGCAAGEPLDDPEAVDVGERLVEEAQLAQFLGLVDDRRERRADTGG